MDHLEIIDYDSENDSDSDNFVEIKSKEEI